MIVSPYAARRPPSRSYAGPAEVPVDRPGVDWDFWIPVINSEVAAAPTAKMFWIGSSSTNRWRTTGLTRWTASYVNTGRVPINAGIPSDNAGNVIYRVLNSGHLSGITPKLAVVQVGSNNNDDPYHIVDAAFACAEAILAAKPSCKILMQAITPRDSAGSNTRRVHDEANALLASRRELDNETYFYANFNASCLLPGTKDLDPAIVPDTVHLSAAGYDIWADTIEPIVAAIVD